MAQVDYDTSQGGWWNPGDSGYTWPDQTNTPAPSNVPTPAPAASGRQSHHWHDIPDAYESIPGIFDWANDPNIDPNAKVQEYLASQRQQGRTDEGDAPALTGAGFLGGRPPAAAAQAAPRPAQQPQMPNQFDDPYTNLLENISKSQMGEIRSNPQLDQLKTFLNSRFQELSSAPGFSPAEMAVLNTQAFEPIEEMRKAAQQRSLDRTAARGFLPSSGLAELDARSIDQDFDKLRTVANRDLAVRAIDRRDSDLNQAGSIAAQLGLQIPQSQRSEELNLANLLYGLPRNALMDALAVVNGSGNPASLYAGSSLMAQQQQYEEQMNAARWNQIAQLLASILT